MLDTTGKNETLNYIGKATKAKHGKNGFIYLHRWETGWEELIFDTKEAADRVREKFGTKEYEEFLKTPA